VSSIFELSKVESCSGRDGNVVEDDGRAAALVLDSRGSVGEGAAGTGFEGRVREGGSNQAAEKDD
jgi:hypothetical protein